MLVSNNGPSPVLLFLSITFCLLLPTIASVCDVQRDDIRFFGSGGDAGRVEVCYEQSWRYVCSDQWSLRMANVACRQLGYQSAFMASSAAAMAFGATIDSGVNGRAGVRVGRCGGNESSLRECDLQVDAASCTIHQAVGAACSTALSDTAESTYPMELEERVKHVMEDMKSWFDSEQARLQQQQSLSEQECTDGTGLVDKRLPTPFQDRQTIEDAFVFSDDVLATYKQLEANFNETLPHTEWLNEQFQESLGKIRWNAYGLDFTDLFPPPMTLDQVQSVTQQSPILESIRTLYLSANRHNALHWFLDSPYRYYSQPKEQQLDSAARAIFDALQRDGIARIDNFGADIDTIVKLAQNALQGASLYRKNETSIAGGGSIITSRKAIAQLDNLLIHNETVKSAINAYLGPSILHGYKVTHITKGLTSTDQYNAGLYHHDRVGRRLKLFVFLNDVDCEMGHPTRVAAGSHKLLYYKSEEYPVTRFSNEYVEKNYDIIRGCGKRGGGFLFDTHTIHKGTVEGDRERTVVIAEYHHMAKCAYSKEHNLGIPCPAGDIYRTDTPLTT